MMRRGETLNRCLGGFIIELSNLNNHMLQEAYTMHKDMSRSGNIGKWYVHAFAMAPTLRFESHSLIFYLFCVELDEIQMP